jgi:hypothetical protein
MAMAMAMAMAMTMNDSDNPAIADSIPPLFRLRFRGCL